LLRSLAVLALLALAGCGLAPVYSGGSRSAAAASFEDISVASIPDRSGFLMRQALLDRLGGVHEDTRYRLEVELDDQIVAFGVRGDNSAARERRTLRARYRLVDTSNNEVVLDATAGADSGIDRVSSNYAVVAAEATALERLATELARQISARLAIFARQQAQATPPGEG
jgi:LPS-assembly lipoprotein